MEIKFDVRITAPEIAEAILELARAVEGVQVHNIREGGEKMDDDEIIEVEISDAEDDGEKVEGCVSFKMLWERFVELSRDGRQDEIRALLSRYGVRKLTDLPMDKYDEIYSEVEKW